MLIRITIETVVHAQSYLYFPMLDVILFTDPSPETPLLSIMGFVTKRKTGGKRKPSR